MLFLHAVDDRTHNIMQPELSILAMFKGSELRWVNARKKDVQKSKIKISKVQEINSNVW